MIDRFTTYCKGFHKKGSDDLFERGSSILFKATKNVMKQFQEEGLVFEKYKPKSVEIVTNLIKNKLKPSEFTKIQPIKYFSEEKPKKSHFRTIILFFIGGATFQEARELQILAE